MDHADYPQIASGIKWQIPERRLDYGLISELMEVCREKGRGSPQAKKIRSQLNIKEPKRVGGPGGPRIPAQVTSLEILVLNIINDGGIYTTEDIERPAKLTRKAAQERIRYLWIRGLVDRTGKLSNGHFTYQINDKGVHLLAERAVNEDQ